MNKDKIAQLYSQRSDSNLIRVYQADSSGSHKLISIMFHLDRNGRLQIYVQPYLKSTQGLISKCIQRPGQDSLSLEPNGKVTTKLPKYSHGQDGMAHFSGNVFATIRNQARRLDNLDVSQLFSITIHGYSAFKDLGNIDASTNEYVKLETNPLDANKTLRIAGWWLNTKNVQVDKMEVGPHFVYEQEGKPRNAIMIAPSFQMSDHALAQYFLLLDFTFEETPLNPANYTIMGGFDPERKPDKNFAFIVQTYPAANFDELEDRLGNIDYLPDKEPPIPTAYLQ